MKSKEKQSSLFSIKNKRHIRGKIVTILVFSILALVLITLGVSIGMSYRTTMSSIRTFMTESAEIAANNINSTVEAKLLTVKEFASRAYFIQDNADMNEIGVYCGEFAKRQNFILATYADKDGLSNTGDNISDRDYFKACKSTLEPVISDPLLSKATGDMIIVLAAPVLKDGAFDGIIIAHGEAGFLSALTNSISIGETGSCYMINSEGDTIAHYDEAKVINGDNIIEQAASDKSLSAIAEIQTKMIKEEPGFDTYRYNGRQKMLGYAPIGVNGWSIGLAGDTIEFMGSLYFSIIFVIVLAVISIMAAILISRKQIDRMVKPLLLCSDRIVLLGQGDLKAQFPVIDSRDEIGAMAEAAKKTIHNLQEIIFDVDNILGQMAAGNFNVETKARDIYQGDFTNLLVSMETMNTKLCGALSQIDDASQQVALGSGQMAESAQLLAEGATEQAGAVEELTATIESVTSIARDSAVKTNTAYERSREFESKAEESSKELENLTKAMHHITETSGEIEKIISEIEDIASQTNLLSLNASIEAARAGEAGKGFAVVADQIGKLASDSAQSAVNTRELIVKSIQEIKNGNDITKRTVEALKGIIEGIGSIARSSKETSELSSAQAETMEQIEKGIEQISQVVQSNSAAAQETSATSEELSAQSENLKGLVAQFKLKK